MDEIVENWGQSKKHFYLLFVFFGFIYVCFPTSNSTMDAIGFAADAKWNSDLYHPHHLLYTSFLHYLSFVIHIESLALGKLMNAFFATSCLVALWQCVKLLQSSTQRQFWFVAFAGSSFAMFRFATENETYILPLFFSLVGTYYFIKFNYESKNRQLFFAGFWLAFACLFHQLHFFWWFVFFIFLLFTLGKKLEKVVLYAFPALMIPIAYFLALVFYRNIEFGYWAYYNFVFESFFRGTAAIEIKIMGIARFFISLVRTFFHVHGTMFLFLKKLPFFCTIPLALIVGFGYLLLRNYKKIKKIIVEKSTFASLFFVLIVVQLGFALVSFGNSEFMVMLPFLGAMTLCFVSNININSLRYFVIFQLLWNVLLGVLPNHFITFRSDEYWAKKIVKCPNAIFYMSNYGEISGMVYGINGIIQKNTRFSNPFSISQKNEIDSLLNANILIYSDCIKPLDVINTETILYAKANQVFFESYKTVLVDSIQGFSGKEYLYQIYLK